MNETNLLEDQPIAWTPTPEVIERAQLTRFMKQVGVATWDELYAHSIGDVEKFTEELLKFLDIKFDPPYEKLLNTSNGVEFPEWFGERTPPSARIDAFSHADEGVRSPSAGLNITEMCLDRWQTDEMRDQPAVIWEGEDGSEATLSYAELLSDVTKCAAGLRLKGLGNGDAIGIHMPMIPETVIALLAINRIGAIAVPVFSGYGVEAIVSRMNAVGAKALFTCPNFTRRGKQTQLTPVGFEAAGKCPTLKYLFIVPAPMNPPPRPLKPGELSEESRKLIEAYQAMSDEERAEYRRIQKAENEQRLEEFFVHLRELGTSETKIDEVRQQMETQSSGMGVISFAGNISKTRIERPFRVQDWRGLLDQGSAIANDSSIHRTSAEDPLIILYTSGTTGKPKGIAHTHASFPIKAAQDMAFGTDVGQGTRISWYTDIGWMMGPWLIYGALINGATICIYDGAPDYPTPDRMWEFCAKHKVEVLGISPTLIRSLAAAEGSADASVRQSLSESSTPTTKITPKRGWHSRGHLPHFDADVTQFVSFRLADSLPQTVIRRIEEELNAERPNDLMRAKRIKVEEYLDNGLGDCILLDLQVAAIVRDVILREDGKTCRIDAWVIMPNHVHLVLRPNPQSSLSTIMQTIKSVSSHKINKQLGRSGPIWQADYFDRYIRDWEHFQKAIVYVENNPVKAVLCSSPGEWKFSSASPGERTPSSASGEDLPHADEGVRPPFERHDLSSLRIFASTGEPWNPAPWWWLFEKVGNGKLPIINYSGGTEIAGGILMGNPLLPIKPCSFPAPCPGMDVDILDEDGNPVGPGKVGELVIKQPWIGMARGFWQEKERYLDTYWRRFKDIWVHGDFAMRDRDGHWFILGRSDDTLKVAGKRVGPAEVESLLVAHPLVTEAAVIGVPDEVKGTAMVAFVVMNDEFRISNIESKAEKDPTFDIRNSKFEIELKALVAKDMGKPLAPSLIHFVEAIPKTRNAKVMRRVIRSAYLGEDPGDLSALENPDAVDEIRKKR